MCTVVLLFLTTLTSNLSPLPSSSVLCSASVPGFFRDSKDQGVEGRAELDPGPKLTALLCFFVIVHLWSICDTNCIVQTKWKIDCLFMRKILRKKTSKTIEKLHVVRNSHLQFKYHKVVIPNWALGCVVLCVVKQLVFITSFSWRHSTLKSLSLTALRFIQASLKSRCGNQTP